MEFYINAVLAIAGLAYGFYVLPSGKLRNLFLLAFAFMAAYRFYDPANAGNDINWFRHLLVLTGEVFFFFFITTFTQKFIEIEAVAPVNRPKRQTRSNMFLPVAGLGGFSIYDYVTSSGLPHIFLAPIFLVAAAVVLIRISAYSSKYKSVAQLSVAACGAFIMLHVGEFLFESQKVITASSDVQHRIELFWFTTGTILFLLALSRFKAKSAAR